MSMIDFLVEQEHDAQGKLKGVSVGVVTNINDPKKRGRVKVRFPWREEQDNKDDSYWARLATMMAGPDRGSFFVPEVGDEVLVAFEKGEIAHPFVIGALWNGQDAPPEPNFTEENNVRRITSRAGHELIFDDDKQEQAQKVEVHTAAGHKVLLDDASGGEKIEIIDKTGSNKIVIDSVGNKITIESAAELKIASQKISIEAGAAMDIKAGATLTIQGALVKIN